ncbi:hypothetical protein D3C75_1252440 [compost metagenome]
MAVDDHNPVRWGFVRRVHRVVVIVAESLDHGEWVFTALSLNFVSLDHEVISRQLLLNDQWVQEEVIEWQDRWDDLDAELIVLVGE